MIITFVCMEQCPSIHVLIVIAKRNRYAKYKHIINYIYNREGTYTKILPPTHTLSMNCSCRKFPTDHTFPISTYNLNLQNSSFNISQAFCYHIHIPVNISIYLTIKAVSRSHWYDTQRFFRDYTCIYTCNIKFQGPLYLLQYIVTFHLNHVNMLN